MNLTVSPQIRIFALVGVLGALGLAVGMVALSHRSSGSSAAPHVIKPLHPVKKHAVPLPKPAAVHQKVAPAPAKAKPKPAPAARKPAATPAPDGLPAAVAAALREHAVVVVSLYDPQADVDAASVGEASAGAKLAGAGFVALDVLSQKDAEPLTEKLGVLPDPALLVYQRPAKLVLQINGFADRDTVAQAAANARP